MAWHIISAIIKQYQKRHSISVISISENKRKQLAWQWLWHGVAAISNQSNIKWRKSISKLNVKGIDIGNRRAIRNGGVMAAAGGGQRHVENGERNQAGGRR